MQTVWKKQTQGWHTTDGADLEQSKIKKKINGKQKATVQTALHYTVVAAAGMEVQKY